MSRSEIAAWAVLAVLIFCGLFKMAFEASHPPWPWERKHIISRHRDKRKARRSLESVIIVGLR